MTVIEIPDEIWREICSHCDVDAYQVLRQVSTWFRNRSFYTHLVDYTVSVHTSLVERPMVDMQMDYLMWRKDIGRHPLGFRPGRALVRRMCDLNMVGRGLISHCKPMLFNYYNRPEMKYVIDYGKGCVRAIKFPRHVENCASAHSLHVLNEYGDFDEISLEDNDERLGIDVVWKRRSGVIRVEIPDEILKHDCVTELADSSFNQNPYEIALLVFPETARLRDKGRIYGAAYYVNWKTEKLEMITGRCDVDENPLALSKVKQHVAFCNGHFVWVSDSCLHIRYCMSFSFSLTRLGEEHGLINPEIVSFDNRYLVLESEGMVFHVLDFLERTIHPVDGQLAAWGMRGIAVVDGHVVIASPRWTGLGRLKHGEERKMTALGSR